MILTDKERSAIKDLQTQEEHCIEKYVRYGQQAKDPVLKNLFGTLEEIEQKHYQSLDKVLNGQVPECDCNDSKGATYAPQATYAFGTNSEDMKTDKFLATDSIGTEKMVSASYNTDVFTFSNSNVRKLLADIQIEEQNHAEMLNKYKEVNSMV